MNWGPNKYATAGFHMIRPTFWTLISSNVICLNLPKGLLADCAATTLVLPRKTSKITKIMAELKINLIASFVQSALPCDQRKLLD